MKASGSALPGVQLHPASAVRVDARATRHRPSAVSCVVERPLDGDLTTGQEDGGHTLPSRAFDRAHAVPLVMARVARVAGIEHLVSEGQDVADVVSCAAGAGVRDGVGGRMLVRDADSLPWRPRLQWGSRPGDRVSA